MITSTSEYDECIYENWIYNESPDFNEIMGAVVEIFGEWQELWMKKLSWASEQSKITTFGKL